MKTKNPGAGGSARGVLGFVLGRNGSKAKANQANTQDDRRGRRGVLAGIAACDTPETDLELARNDADAKFIERCLERATESHWGQPPYDLESAISSLEKSEIEMLHRIEALE